MVSREKVDFYSQVGQFGQLAEKSETSSPYVNRIIKKSEVLNKTFVRMMEELGYDIELTYVKRTEE